ncbi:Alpha-ketoglutarate-dependent dioxygenase alkB 7, mitochondrial, partial [Linnemannia gamsii]
TTTTEDKDGTLHRYTHLTTPASIASTHFDLSHIPPQEHAQILHDFILVPEYLSPEEHDMMVKGATLKLKRALGKQVRYEDGHFDRVITRYRECSAGDWSSSHPLPATNPSTSSQPSNNSTTTKKERTTPLEMMTSIKSEFFPSTWNWVAPHILELEAGQGGIKPHVDHLDASGSVVAGLCLGSSAVMELIHQDDPQKWFRVLLPKRCFYFQRDSVRYSYKHGIPIEAEDHQFKGVVVPKEKRISVMLRNALGPPPHTNRPSTMY